MSGCQDLESSVPIWIKNHCKKMLCYHLVYSDLVVYRLLVHMLSFF